ncbi:MAG: serine/threonine protein phosphatase [Alphaproteobacteria bacterium]|nr:serine/threonine protein phosphatase [Alphaproteobacteria bacterium]
MGCMTLGPHDRVYAVGDIHGRLDLLDRLYRLIRQDSDNEPPGRRTVVHLGDYVDRGPDSRGVVERVMAPPLPGFESVALLGNHDFMMRGFLDHPAEVGPGWLVNGGTPTLASYGVEPPRRLDADEMVRAAGALAQALPAAHRAFLDRLAPHYRAGPFLFVHAGIRPGRPVDAQALEDLIWIREEFLDSRADHGAVVVHGHTITREPDFRPNRIGIDTGAYRSGRLTALRVGDGATKILQT